MTSQKVNLRNLKIGIFADTKIGFLSVEYIFKNYNEDISFVCITDENLEILKDLIALGVSPDKILIYDKIHYENFINQVKTFNADLYLLAWWPYIIKEDLINLPSKGVLNFHPSLLPYNRGKQPSFWNIVEDVPYGVTIHFVEKGIDSGDIAFQKEIEKSWEDTGFTLYKKSQKEILKLFKNNYPKIRRGNLNRTKQNLKKGSFHYSKELLENIEIFLDKKYIARNLLNLLRAKKFPNSKKCFFIENDTTYEVEITIKKQTI